MTPRSTRVLFHNNCFDGAVSAALVSELLVALSGPRDFLYEGLTHGPDPFRGGEVFEGAHENALVDFRYTTSERLDWWFDHHVSAFSDAAAEAHFRQRDPARAFFDPEERSCTGLLVRVSQERFGVDLRAGREELVRWAERIDSADFDSPEHALSLEEPALQLMAAIEQSRDPAWMRWMITQLRQRSLEAIAAEDPVRERVALARRRLVEAIDATRAVVKLIRAELVFADLIDARLYAVNKFIPYLLYPEATYALWSFTFPHAIKISVGSNPWRPELRRHDIAALCERYGGGGHPFVGAISVPRDQPGRARAILDELIQALA